MGVEFYQLPDIQDFSRHSVDYLINNILYTFYFTKNFRDNSIMLSISYENEGIETFVLRSILLTPNVNLAKYLTEDKFYGSLYLIDSSSYDRTPTEQLTSEYVFAYITE